MNGQKGIASIIIILIIVALLAGGIFAWQNWFRKISLEKLGEIAFLQNGNIKISPEKLKLGEIAFLQNGDIWVAVKDFTGKDFKSKYKAIDTKEAITSFAISPNGKEIYWLNEKKELWKKDYDGIIKPLVSIEKDMEEVVVEEGIEALDGKTSYLKGEVQWFSLSPDGKFIAYSRLEEFTVGGGFSNVPVYWIWIMKNDGSQKVKIEKPIGDERELISFRKWFPDSKRILIYFGHPSGGGTTGSPFYEVGIDGKNPKVYLLTGYDERCQSIFDTEPVFSPDGTRAVYFTWAQEKTGIWLVNTDGSDRKEILLEGDFWGGRGGGVKHYLSWSEDGTLLAVSMDREVFVFNRQGNLISEFEVIKLGEGGKWNRVSHLTISSDKKYIVGQYQIEGEEFPAPFLVNISNKEIKKFQYPKLENVPIEYGYSFSPQFLSKKGNLLYYLISFYPRKIMDTPPPPDQFWVLDLNSGENYKIMEGALQITKMP